MGLNRIVSLSFRGFSDTKSDRKFLLGLTDLANEMYDAGFIDGDCNEITEYVNWYDIVDDMKELSAFFPDVVLIVNVSEGGGLSDWTAFFQDGEMANELTYPVFYDFDKTKWDDVEIKPVWCRDDEAAEPCDEGKESFWSVYLHQVSGGVQCIADFPSKIEAVYFSNLILNISKSKA